MMRSSETIAVMGLGYVGCVTAACLARLGHQVIGVDRDAYKVQCVLQGKAPFYEPGLEDLVREAIAAGRLSATTAAAEAIAAADIALICVGTPSERNGNLGLEQLRRVAQDIAASLGNRTKPLIVAVRSTVYPGTCEDIARHFDSRLVSIVSNPEFLREGTAVRDFLVPSLLVVGGNDRAAVARVAAVYSDLPVEACQVELRTAELIKYACNAFHAVKIAFANEIGTLAAHLGINGAEVMDTLCQDRVLNVSAAYLKPGFAFGGSCLPKDLRALVYRASRLDLQLPLLESVLPSNDRHLGRALQTVLDLRPARIGVFGLAFKENTDDLRESPVVTMLEQLIGKGCPVRVYDPHIRLGEIYGSNERYLLSAIPHIGKLLVTSIQELLEWSETIVITQKMSPESAAALEASGRTLIDLSATIAAVPIPAAAASA